MGWHHAQAKWYTYAAEETVEQGSAVEKKMQDIIRFYTQTSHGFHFTIYFPIGPCEETSSTWGAREGRRADSRASRLGARNRTPRGGRAGSRAFLLTPSAFPLDFWQRRYIYIFFGRVYVLFMYRVYCREATTVTQRKEIGGVRPITSHASRPAPSVLYIYGGGSKALAPQDLANQKHWILRKRTPSPRTFRGHCHRLLYIATPNPADIRGHLADIAYLGKKKVFYRIACLTKSYFASKSNSAESSSTIGHFCLQD